MRAKALFLLSCSALACPKALVGGGRLTLLWLLCRAPDAAGVYGAPVRSGHADPLGELTGDLLYLLCHVMSHMHVLILLRPEKAMPACLAEHDLMILGGSQRASRKSVHNSRLQRVGCYGIAPDAFTMSLHWQRAKA